VNVHGYGRKFTQRLALARLPRELAGGGSGIGGVDVQGCGARESVDGLQGFNFSDWGASGSVISIWVGVFGIGHFSGMCGCFRVYVAIWRQELVWNNVP
jgi:hypothetical protein